MSSCKLIFGNDLYDLDLSDLEKFFAIEQEETSILEFKSGDVQYETIYKEVAAFLNTEGGILVIGAPKEKEVEGANGRKRKVATGALTASAIPSQDVLFSKIAANLSPTPVSIKAKTFPNLNGHVYVLEITQSMTPPHQVNNEGKYYIRLEREAKAAPHGIVAALFYKRQRPALSFEIVVGEKAHKPDSSFIRFTLRNTSSFFAEGVGYMIDIIGVKAVVDSNVSAHYTLFDEAFQSNHILKDQILVKGISATIEYGMEFSSRVIFISLGYYCKDFDLQTQTCLYDVVDGKYIRKAEFSATEDNSDVISLEKEYKLLRRTNLREMIDGKGDYNKDYKSPLNSDTVLDTYRKLRIALPLGYLEFLENSNGASFVKGDYRVDFLPLDEINFLFEGENAEKFVGIGETTFNVIVLKTDGSKSSYWHFGRNGQGEYFVADTFYEYLKEVLRR